jgi:hypothetical protein
MYQKSGLVKPGMTYSQVYAILPPQTKPSPLPNRKELEEWSFGRNSGDSGDIAYLQVIFGTDGRVQKINRRIEHMRFGIATEVP